MFLQLGSDLGFQGPALVVDRGEVVGGYGLGLAEESRATDGASLSAWTSIPCSR